LVEDRKAVLDWARIAENRDRLMDEWDRGNPTVPVRRPNARRIAAVEALPEHRLRIVWQDGGEAVVDMTGVIHKQAYFAALKDNDLFRQVTIIDYGTGIEWANGIDYSADSIEVLAHEQAAMTNGELRVWKRDMALSTNEMADIFGISASTVKAYLAGDSRIPIAVQIACQAMRENRAILDARFRPRVAGRPRKNPVAA
jgi:hypothetical protein